MNLLLVGLGNPGEKYSENRHNAGFMFLDWLMEDFAKRTTYNAQRFKFDKYSGSELAKIAFHDSRYTLHVFLAKPQTFMNRSGDAVHKLLATNNLQSSTLFVIHDDLDIRLDNFKIQKAVGPKMHNGIESVEQYLKTKDFWRIRIGIDNRTSDSPIPGEPYVLSDFSKQESKTLSKTFPRILSKLQMFLADPSNL